MKRDWTRYRAAFEAGLQPFQLHHLENLDEIGRPLTGIQLGTAVRVLELYPELELQDLVPNTQLRIVRPEVECA